MIEVFQVSPCVCVSVFLLLSLSQLKRTGKVHGGQVVAVEAKLLLADRIRVPLDHIHIHGLSDH